MHPLGKIASAMRCMGRALSAQARIRRRAEKLYEELMTGEREYKEEERRAD